MNRSLCAALLVFTLGLGSAPSLAMDPPPLTPGQTVYVPVYSHVLHGNQDGKGQPEQWLLAAMLSVRNTDPVNALTLRSVRYFDTNGTPIREYLTQPRKIGPMATAEVFVEHKDSAGGTGANFLVAWEADKPINAPIIETVHTYFFGTRSVTFTSPGQPIRLDTR
jgi:hypothetical protein